MALFLCFLPSKLWSKFAESVVFSRDLGVFAQRDELCVKKLLGVQVGDAKAWRAMPTTCRHYYKKEVCLNGKYQVQGA